MLQTLRAHGLSKQSHVVGKTNDTRQAEVWRDAKKVFAAPLHELQQEWDQVAWRIARERDNPACADQEHALSKTPGKGLHWLPSFDVKEDIAAPYIARGVRPKVAILREQGVNSQVEMAYAIDRRRASTRMTCT